MTNLPAVVDACPTPDKKQYRSQAEANRFERKFTRKGGKDRLYPYVCASGDHWHLTHHTPDAQKQVTVRANPQQPIGFTYEGMSLRTVMVGGEPWFVAADVAVVLEYRMASDMTRRLDASDKGYAKVRTPGGDQGLTIISEAGLYDAVFRSNAEGAKPFRHWVTRDVLPAIRKTGRYDPSIALPDRKTLAQWVVEAETRAEVAEAKVVELEPKAEFYDDLMDADGKYSMGAAAKAIGWGRNSMMLELRRAGVLTGQNLPYQRYAHHFKVIPQTFSRNGETFATATTYVLPSGLDFLRKKLDRLPAVVS